jgi:porin
MRARCWIAGGWLALSAITLPAHAQTTPPGVPAQPAAPETSDKPAEPEKAPSIATSLPNNGDPGGTRASLEEAGIAYSLTYIGEVLGNTRGGIRRDAVYQGRLDVQLDADLEKLLKIPGLAFHTNFYQIHGRGVSGCCLGGNLLTTSGIEATPATRLFELWLEQKLLDGKVSVRAGQLAADSEFILSQYGGLFVNATFGWPAITATNLPSGGPAYPLATPAVRVKLAPTDQLTFLGAVFNGDPAGPGPGDPQRRNSDGLSFRTRDPALFIGEAAYTYNKGKDAAGLPGTIKFGGWHHLGRFDDQRFGIDGLSLADPSSAGIARRFRGNSGIYGVIDQLIYRVPGTDDQGLGVFARVSGSPSDRNVISFYADGGLTYKGFILGRPDDTFGVGFGYAQISQRARGLDRDTRGFGVIDGTDPATGLYAGPFLPIRSSEALIEVTYQATVVPGFTVQPDFQYIFRPGGNVSNPRDPNGAAVKNAAIFGLRVTIRH